MEIFLSYRTHANNKNDVISYRHATVIPFNLKHVMTINWILIAHFIILVVFAHSITSFIVMSQRKSCSAALLLIPCKYICLPTWFLAHYHSINCNRKWINKIFGNERIGIHLEFVIITTSNLTFLCFRFFSSTNLVLNIHGLTNYRRTNYDNNKNSETLLNVNGTIRILMWEELKAKLKGVIKWNNLIRDKWTCARTLS